MYELQLKNFFKELIEKNFRPVLSNFYAGFFKIGLVLPVDLLAPLFL